MSYALATPAVQPVPAPHQFSQGETGSLLSNIKIPPQPEIVRALIAERARDEPDLQRIVQLISHDVGLAAAVLKAINSPYYGMRGRITSVQHAVALLGLKNVGSLVMGLALRTNVKVEGIERYWESASRSAELAGMIARKRALAVEDAHLYTLFHDSGIPVLLQYSPGYRQTMQEMSASDWMDITAMEDQRHQTNHAVVGGLLARNWGLPDHISTAISLHHDITVFDSESLPNQVLNLIAVGHVAENIEAMLARQENDCQCEIFGLACTRHLMIGQDDLQEIIDAAMDLFDMVEY